MDRIKFCKQCDATINFSAAFCEHCGATQVPAAPATEQERMPPSAEAIAAAIVRKEAEAKAKHRAEVDAHNAEVNRQTNRFFAWVAVLAVVLWIPLCSMMNKGDGRADDRRREQEREREERGREFDALQRGDIPGNSVREKAQWLKDQQDAARERWIDDR